MGPATLPWKTNAATETETYETSVSVLEKDDRGQHDLQMTSITPKDSLVSPKQTLRFGCWNVRTMFEAGKLAQVVNEMGRYQLDILGVSEARWTGANKIRYNSGTTVWYSGRSDSDHRVGVAILISPTASKALMEWEPVDERLVRARFNSRYCKLTVIVCYAPTNDDSEETKDSFYIKLQILLDKTPKHDMLVVMGDLNAKVGTDNIGNESVMGKEGLGIRNDKR